MAARERHLLPQPAVTVARHLVRGLLEEAQGAASRLDADDAEALHDFRVAIRRLRTLLRAYRGLNLAPDKAARRLRKLAGITNEARDLEVAIDYLRHEAADEPVAAAVADALAARFRRVHEETLDELKQRWPRVSTRLHRALDQEPPVQSLSFRACAARLVTEEADRLRQLLDALRAGWQDATAHRARLRGKRLRYLLEPLTAELPTAREAIGALKTFQDRLGRYHDLGVLLGVLAENAAEEAARATHARLTGSDVPLPPVERYLALANRLRAERRRLAGELAAAYLGAECGLLLQVERVIEALTSA